MNLKESLDNITIDKFHNLYYHSPDTWPKNTFLGYPIQQNPIDMHIYQELIFKHKPSFIIQTGVADGGSILYFSSLLDLIGVPAPIVIGVDIKFTDRAKKLKNESPRIILIEGNSLSFDTYEQIGEILEARDDLSGRGMVVLDSDHKYDHVLEEIMRYEEFVGVGQYLVVEDTNINGHPVYHDYGRGPKEAVDVFLQDYSVRFVRDDSVWKRHLFSHHQGGWLKRIS